MLTWFTITTRNATGQMGAVYTQAPDAIEAHRKVARHYAGMFRWQRQRVCMVRACKHGVPPLTATIIEEG